MTSRTSYPSYKLILLYVNQMEFLNLWLLNSRVEEYGNFFLHCMCIKIYGKEWRFLFLKFSFYLANWENQNITCILNFPVQSIAELPHSQYKRVVCNSKKCFYRSVSTQFLYISRFLFLMHFSNSEIYNQIIFFLEFFF